MFTVLITLCLGQISQCFLVSDLWGPYDTQKKCEARLEQMITRIEEEFPTAIFFQKKCIKKELHEEHT